MLKVTLVLSLVQKLGDVLKELKRSKCMDPAGFVREMFINDADPVIISHGQFYMNKALVKHTITVE